MKKKIFTLGIAPCFESHWQDSSPLDGTLARQSATQNAASKLHSSQAQAPHQ
jgi:hypothetical protein